MLVNPAILHKYTCFSRVFRLCIALCLDVLYYNKMKWLKLQRSNLLLNTPSGCEKFNSDRNIIQIKMMCINKNNYFSLPLIISPIQEEALAWKGLLHWNAN